MGGLGVEGEESLSLVEESGEISVLSLSSGESSGGGLSLEERVSFFLPHAKRGMKERASARAAKALIFIVKNLRCFLLRSSKKAQAYYIGRKRARSIERKWKSREKGVKAWAKAGIFSKIRQSGKICIAHCLKNVKSCGIIQQEGEYYEEIYHGYAYPFYLFARWGKYFIGNAGSGAKIRRGLLRRKRAL